MYKRRRRGARVERMANGYYSARDDQLKRKRHRRLLPFEIAVRKVCKITKVPSRES